MEGKALSAAGSGPGYQPLESGILPERIEHRIDLEPGGREIVRDLEQRLQLVERLFVLARQKVDPDELMLQVGSGIAVLRGRDQLHRAPAFPDRIGLAAQVGQRAPEN